MWYMEKLSDIMSGSVVNEFHVIEEGIFSAFDIIENDALRQKRQ